MDTTVADPHDVLVTLRRCAAVGPFFALDDVDRPAQSAADAITALATAARAPHPRVAASLVTMSVAGRVLSVAVAAALLDGVVLDVRSARWRYDAGSGARVRLAVPVGWRVAADAGPGISGVFADAVLPVVDAVVLTPVRAVAAVSPRALWGNVASSLAGALQSLAASGAVTPAECREFGDGVLAHPLLAGTGGFVGSGLGFRRRSCCLLHRLPAGGVCGDCVLRR